MHSQFKPALNWCKMTIFYPDIFFPVALRPNAGQGLLILEVSKSYTTKHNSRYDSSGRVISSSHRPLADNTQHSQQTNIHDSGGIRTHDFSRRATADLRLRPHGHWDRHPDRLQLLKFFFRSLFINSLLSLPVRVITPCCELIPRLCRYLITFSLIA